MPLRKLKYLTIKEKYKLIDYFDSDKRQKDICAKNNIPKSTLSTIIKKKKFN